jgi:hypothetical protein
MCGPTWSRWSAPARGSRAASSSNDPTNQEVISRPRDQGGHETSRHVCQRELPGQVRLLDRWGAWLDSDVQGGPVDELLDVAVERPVLDQLQVEVGRTLEDRVEPGLTGDDREERHLHPVD